ncbi:hypothetical protein C2U70_20840 [Bradyrhizobium guangdongense]|uniref:hypothetical protein n=1 Tax=Bradyrhizobium guangdongense TaxID=1325090 RepID=UPI00112EA703|nr:hypothetical protein [Bradyrhizobium guangdongense]TPQ32813.1 hypothetical protein C2U70_20840 [Bradyrhizobium guangdongense]
MPNVIFMPNAVSRSHPHQELVIEIIPSILRQLEMRLVQASALVSKCADGDKKRALLAESVAISSLIVQAREKAGRLISRS